jgi:sirohydrochlorin cobaltochelatase
MIAAGDKGGAGRALILFAHGSREPGWADPFERLTHIVRAAAPGQEVRLAFLELMHPDLSDAVAELAARSVRQICVVPIFLGSGGHLRRDLTRMIEDLRVLHPGVAIACATPAGEEPRVLEAIAEYCVAQLGANPVNAV